MPRTGRGGKRELAIGTNSGNRTDLNAHLPETTVPDQPYGEAAQQRLAQGAVPMAPTPAPGAVNPTPLAPLQALSRNPGAKPGSLPWLEPTNRPNEPVTTGLPTGAGAGPEVLNQQVLPTHPVASAFDDLAGGGSAVSSLADTARVLGL